MSKPVCYSIDTSALINWWIEDYSPDVFPGLVPKLEALIAEGRLRAVRSVKDELGKGELRDWCLKQEDFFVDEDEEVQRRVARLMATYRNPKKTRGIDKADPFVIAFARDGHCSRSTLSFIDLLGFHAAAEQLKRLPVGLSVAAKHSQ